MSSSATLEVVDALPTTNTTLDVPISQLPEASSSHLFPNESSASIPHESDVYSPPKPSVRLLFSLLPRRDLYLCLLPAILLSMVAGVVAPFMTLVLGNVFNTFAKFCRLPSPTSSDRSNLKHDVAIAALELLALAAGSLALSSLTSFLWILTGERNSLMIRRKVYASVSSREMAWFDTKMGAEEGAQEGDGSTGAGGLMAKFARWVAFASWKRLSDS
jgi:ATP-binding cassette, subfamily B (MDR/TAP), member 1